MGSGAGECLLCCAEAGCVLPSWVLGWWRPPGQLTPLLFLCMILHGPSPSPSADPQLRVGVSWGRAGGGRAELGPGGLRWEPRPAQHLPNPQRQLPHDRARQPCCWGRGAGRCVRRCQIRAAVLAVGTRPSSGPGCGVSSSCLFLPLLASFPSPKEVFVKMPQLSAGHG